RLKRRGGPGGAGGAGGAARRSSNSSDGLLDPEAPPEGGGVAERGAGSRGGFWSCEAEARLRAGGGGGRRGGRGGAAYGELLPDSVWGKRQQAPPGPANRVAAAAALQRPLLRLLQPAALVRSPAHLPPPRRPAAGQGDRTKSCGPFPAGAAGPEPDPQPPLCPPSSRTPPHLLPPRPPQPPPGQDAQLEDATRSLHKALALEGLRDWYLRNTLGPSHQNQANAKAAPGAAISTAAAMNGGVKGGVAGGGGALQRRRTTHGAIPQPTYQTEAGPRHPAPRHKQTLPHSATFHGHPLNGRSVDGHLYPDPSPSRTQEVPIRDPLADQPSPGTLV
uniref:Coiled-coil domain containing 120 n=1 Tax=Salarias fasciatus TaxID=181472 RepID=A0A672I9L3_SALFA